MLDSNSGNNAAQATGFAWRGWAWALGALATAAQLYLVWGFDFFPTVDGPAHVHLAYAIYEALQGDSFYGGLVELNSRLNPNLATQTMLVALMAIVPPLVAEKLWLTLYFISFTGASAYALAGINRKSLCLLPLLVFCSISLPLAFGFYNFSLSTVIFLVWLGYWWRHRDEFSIRVVLVHALLATFAYAIHVFAFVASVLAIAVTGLTAIIMRTGLRAEERDKEPPAGWRSILTHAVPPLLGSIPGVVASLYFLLVRFGSATSSGAASLEFDALRRIRAFLTGTSFSPYDDIEFIAAAVFAAGLIATTLLLLRNASSVKRSLPFAACFLAFLVLYLAMPQQWIVRWMPSRFQPLVFVVLLLWVAALVPPTIKPLQWKLAGAAGLALVLVSLIPRIQLFSQLDGYYREISSAAPYIKVNSTLVAIRLNNRVYGQPFPAKLDVLLQAGSRVASERDSIDLKNFQGQAESHPIQFRQGVGAAASLGGDGALISLSPDIDLLAYERQTGRPIDYVLVHGFRDFAMSSEGLMNLDRQLGESYRRIFVSKGGFMHLYERKSSKQSDVTR